MMPARSPQEAPGGAPPTLRACRHHPHDVLRYDLVGVPYCHACRVSARLIRAERPMPVTLDPKGA